MIRWKMIHTISTFLKYCLSIYTKYIVEYFVTTWLLLSCKLYHKYVLFVISFYCAFNSEEYIFEVNKYLFIENNDIDIISIYIYMYIYT